MKAFNLCIRSEEVISPKGVFYLEMKLLLPGNVFHEGTSKYEQKKTN